MKPKSVWPVLIGAAVCSLVINGAARAGGAQIPSLLECSPVSTNPKSKKFTTALPLFFADGTFKGERTTEAHPGKEVYSGSIDRSKAIKIAGRGAYDDGSDSWRSTFSGSLKNGEAPVLKGYLDTTRRRGRRDCSITFLLPSDTLASLLVPPPAPSGAPATPVQGVQAKVQAQGEAAKDSNASPERQHPAGQQPAGTAQDSAERQSATQERAPQAAAATEAAAKNQAQKPLPSAQTAPTKNAEGSAHSAVNDYITAHGGCAALSRSWEAEFHRPDRAPPYGKPFVNWDQDDFSVLRKWVEQCLDPYLARPGYREQMLAIYDSKVRQYQREQESARAELRRQEQLAAERDAQIQALMAQYDSALPQMQDAIKEFEDKALPFLDQTRSLQLADIGRVVELGRQAASLGSRAQALVSAASKASSNLDRFVQAQVNRPVLDGRHKSETTSRQVGAAFDRVQAVVARVGNVLDRAQRIQARHQPCGQRLADAGIPREIIETKIYEAKEDGDSYLFEAFCPSSSTHVNYSGRSRSSKLLELDLGETPVRLWFDLRDDDGSRTWSQDLDGPPTPTSRLILRRVSAGSTDESAQANWDSVNLLNTAALLLALSK